MDWQYTLEKRELQWALPKNIFCLGKEKLYDISLAKICNSSVESS